MCGGPVDQQIVCVNVGWKDWMVVPMVIYTLPCWKIWVQVPGHHLQVEASQVSCKCLSLLYFSLHQKRKRKEKRKEKHGNWERYIYYAGNYLGGKKVNWFFRLWWFFHISFFFFLIFIHEKKAERMISEHNSSLVYMLPGI